MVLKGCCNLVKYLLILFNLLFWITGFAALVLFIWVLIDPSVFLIIPKYESHFYIGLYIFLAVAILLLITAFLGCFGSILESQCLLVSFFCCLLVIIVAEIAAGAWAFHNKDKLEDMIRFAVKNTVQHEYGSIEGKTTSFDTFQRHLECCGANGPNDWATSEFNTKDSTKIYNMEISSPLSIYEIPESCCKLDTNKDICDISRKIPAASIISPVINNKGCTDKIVHAYYEYLPYGIAVIIGIITFEMIGLIFCIMLCCTLRSKSHYKS